ncbi:MAG: YjbQ family protein [Candidatus Marinimicrobia bacterium]|nr:YjbQ family protein [Candidatus Neomarinimicrobiota bacterium]
MEILSISTHQRVDMIDITPDVNRIVQASDIQNGIVTVFVPHTTCGITINEHADPDVKRDILFQLEKIAPYEKGYRHYEKNADSHIKTSLIGSSETILLEDGNVILGTWQGLFLCDFDGPRVRKVYVKILGDAS